MYNFLSKAGLKTLIDMLKTKFAEPGMINNPNLLINPDFKINQREFKGIRYPSSSEFIYYTVDRWAVQPGQGMTVNSDGTMTIYGGCIQKIENDVGDNVTASVGVVSGFASANYDPQTKTFSITTDGESAVISWAKLEIGSLATAFIPPDPATELIKCKRYYQRLSGAYKFLGSGFISSATIASLCCPLPEEMRTSPTVSLSGTAYINLKDHTASNSIKSTKTAGTCYVSQSTLFMPLTPAESIDSSYVGSACLLQLRDTSSYIGLDAEL